MVMVFNLNPVSALSPCSRSGAQPNHRRRVSLPLFLRETPKTPLMLEWHGYGVTGHLTQFDNLVLLPDLTLNLHKPPARYDVPWKGACAA